MQFRNHLFAPLLLALVLFGRAPLAHAEVTDIIYADDDDLAALGKEKLEEVYGAKIIIIDEKKTPPATPKKIKGTILYGDPSNEKGADRKWVVADRSPSLDFDKVRLALKRDYGVKDISDKWEEYQFLQKFVPDLAPPEMRRASDFEVKSLTSEQEEQIKKTMKEHGLEGQKIYNDFAKIESVRSQVQSEMGRSITKIRWANHSEGKLPKSDANWIELYANYLTKVKQEIADLEKRARKENLNFGNEVVKVPGVEAKVLAAMLENPEQVIVQKMIKIKREVRQHIADGDMLDGATFLRFYHMNEYLPKKDKELMEGAVKQHLISKFSGDYKHFYCTPDVVIEIQDDGTEKVRILDFNDGDDSGYYQVHEDIFTANLFREKLGGVRTPFLKEWDKFRAMPLNDAKAEYMKKMRKKYARFQEGDVQNAWWDRVLEHYQEVLSRHPTSDNLDKILGQLKKAGLDMEIVYVQFLNMVQDEWPGLKLRPKREKAWLNYLNKLDPKIHTTAVNGKFKDEEIVDPKDSCKVLKRIGAVNR